MTLRSVARTAFFLFLFLIASHVQAAGLTITEIMFDPAGSDDKREWVEVYNGGSAPLDLSGHFILTDGASSSKHALVAQTGSVLAPASYAVIVQDPVGFAKDFPSYAGSVFDSSWSGLTASVGKTILLIDPESAVLDSVTYDPSTGGVNTGDSLQNNTSGLWVAAVPTPGSALGEENTTVVDDTNENASDDSTDVSGSTASVGGAQAGAHQYVQTPSISAQPHAELVLPERAVTGIPVKISVRAYESGDTVRILGVSHVALGDGSAYTGKALDTFTHVYTYPGAYVVTFEYRGNPYSPDPDLIAHKTIQVSEPAVSIARVTTKGAIELVNTGGREADMSGWIIAPLGDAFAADTFTFPSGTIVLGGKKILLSPKVTGLLPARAQAAVLLLPSGEQGTPLREDFVPLRLTQNTPESSAPEPLVRDIQVTAPLEESVSALSLVEHPKVLSVKEKGLPLFPFTLGVVAVLIAAGMKLWKFEMFKRNASSTVDQAELSNKEEIRILE